MDASDEIQAAVAALRNAATPGSAQIADLLEHVARMTRISEGVWELAGYGKQKQRELAERKWQRELAVARVLSVSLTRGAPSKGEWLWGHAVSE
ncbi:MAG: hypothetical protein ACRDSH_18915 [Pseudonocardiaceae bacterium]